MAKTMWAHRANEQAAMASYVRASQQLETFLATHDMRKAKNKETVRELKMKLRRARAKMRERIITLHRAKAARGIGTIV
jgi:hypothetical protein